MPNTIRSIATGGLIVGLLDLSDAFLFYGIRGVSPVRILQSIASGLLGRESYRLGWRSALLGGLLHFFIASVVATVYLLVSRRIDSLRRHPIAFGALYGVGVWCVMNFVVLPLSAAGSPRFSTPTVVNGLLIHIVGVGIASALVASTEVRGRPAPAPVEVAAR